MAISVYGRNLRQRIGHLED